MREIGAILFCNILLYVSFKFFWCLGLFLFLCSLSQRWCYLLPPLICLFKLLTTYFELYMDLVHCCLFIQLVIHGKRENAWCFGSSSGIFYFKKGSLRDSPAVMWYYGFYFYILICLFWMICLLHTQ